MCTRVPLVCCTACNATAHFAPAHQPRLYLAVRRRAVVHDVTSTFRRPLAIQWSQRGDRPPDQHLGCMRRLTPSASLRCADVRLPGARLRQGVPEPQRACAVPPPPPPPHPVATCCSPATPHMPLGLHGSWNTGAQHAFASAPSSPWAANAARRRAAGQPAAPGHRLRRAAGHARPPRGPHRPRRAAARPRVGAPATQASQWPQRSTSLTRPGRRGVPPLLYADGPLAGPGASGWSAGTRRSPPAPRRHMRAQSSPCCASSSS